MLWHIPAVNVGLCLIGIVLVLIIGQLLILLERGLPAKASGLSMKYRLVDRFAGKPRSNNAYLPGTNRKVLLVLSATSPSLKCCGT